MGLEIYSEGWDFISTNSAVKVEHNGNGNKNETRLRCWTEKVL